MLSAKIEGNNSTLMNNFYIVLGTVSYIGVVPFETFRILRNVLIAAHLPQ